MNTGINTLAKSTLIYTIGNFGSKILSFVLVPLFSYFLSRQQLGEYDLVLTTLNLALPLVSLQMSDSIYRWLLDDHTNEEFNRHLFKQGSSILLASFLLLEIVLYVSGLFWIIPYQKEFSLLIISFCLLPFFQQVLRGLKLVRYYSFVGIINSFLILTLNILFLVTPIFKDKVIGILYALFIANTISILLCAFRIRFIFSGYFKEKINFQLQKKLLLYSLPLVFNALSWWIINASDKYVILGFLGVSDNGIYAVSVKLPAILMILNTVFMLAWQDMAIMTENPDSPFFSKLYNQYISLNMGLSVIFVAASPLITYILFDKDFFEAWQYSPLLFIASSFTSISGFLGAIYLKNKKTTGVLTTSLIAAGLNILVSLSLIKYIGLYAPALGSVVSFGVMFLVRHKQVANTFNLRLNKKRFVQLMVLCFVFMGILLYYKTIRVSIILCVLSLLIFWYYNREVFKLILKKIQAFRR